MNRRGFLGVIAAGVALAALPWKRTRPAIAPSPSMPLPDPWSAYNQFINCRFIDAEHGVLTGDPTALYFGVQA